MRSRTILNCAVCATTLTLVASVALAETALTQPIENEPHKIQALLSQASKYEASTDSTDNTENEWQAAARYCEASRLGSIEAQYRLGMLYAFGKGVPANKNLAATLFSIASNQGHAEAQKMLETINLTSSELPACVTSETLPERKPQMVFDQEPRQTNIERRLEVLPKTKLWIIDLVGTLATWYNIDPKLVLAIIAVESNFDVGAQSPKAAMGLMQLIPDTAARFNIKNAFDASQNIKGGIRYLQWLLSYYQGNISLVSAAYNAGEKAVDRYQGVPPYPETKKYVQRVLNLYQRQSHPYNEKLTSPSSIISKPKLTKPG